MYLHNFNIRFIPDFLYNESVLLKPFKRQLPKMVKHAQTICRLLPKNSFSVFDHFAGLTIKGLSQ